MIKRISLVRRKEGMSLEDFTAAWLGEHADLILRMPRLRGYRVDVIRSWQADPEPWDGIGELWFDSREDLEEAFASLADELAANRSSFLSHTSAAIVDEHVIIREPAAP